MTIKSENLKGRGDICCYVPSEVNASDLPIAILLHGVYGSAWSWALSAGAHLTAERLIQEGQLRPMILAMPSDGLWGDGSAYLPHHALNFEKWIVEDVVDAVRMNISAAHHSSVLFISGLSMGGFGALRIGAKYAKRFTAIAAHSAITHLNQMPLFVEEELAGYQQAIKTDEDVFATMKHHREDLPPIRFDCGTEDLLIDYSRELHELMMAADIPHEYVENPGAHEWSYWEKHLVETLLFFQKQL